MLTLSRGSHEQLKLGLVLWKICTLTAFAYSLSQTHTVLMLLFWISAANTCSKFLWSIVAASLYQQPKHDMWGKAFGGFLYFSVCVCVWTSSFPSHFLGVTRNSCTWLVWDGDPLKVIVQNQTRDLFSKIGSKLCSLGCGWVDVVFTYLFLADMAGYKDINTIYSSFFSVNPPARYVHLEQCVTPPHLGWDFLLQEA